MKKHTVLSQMGQRSEPPPISWLMEVALARPNLISLAAGFTDNPSLPVTATRELLNEILAAPQKGQAALQYGTTAGDVELRQLTARNLQALDQVAGKSDLHAASRVIITNGSQQLLYMVTEALCDAGDVVIVEDPTYFVYLGIAQSRGLKTRGVKMMPDGLDLAHLEQVLESLKRSGEIKRLKMLYLVSYFQNPSGITTSAEKKAAALELLKKFEKAAGHPIYLLEDAAYRELRFTGEDVPSSLVNKKHADRVIYAGTYSKPFSTGARVGFGLLPEPIFTVVTRLKGNHDFGTANLLQQLLKRALSSGKYQQHVAELQTRYACKANVMIKAIRQHLPESVQWLRPNGGLYVWAALPKKIKTGAKSKFFNASLEKDLLYVPGELCYANDATRPKPNHEMRLSFGGANEQNIQLGIERLGAVIRSMSK